MKLIVKTSLYYFGLSLAILIFTGALFFVVLRYHISHEIKEQLDLQTDMVAKEIESRHPVIYPLIEITLPELPVANTAPIFRDTLVYDYLQKEYEGYYYLSQVKKINGQTYRIKVMTTYIGWNEYLKTITFIFFCLAVLLVVAGIVVNYTINRKVWRPFLNNLSALRTYSLNARHDLPLQASDIDEFETLNTILSDYSARTRKEYNGLQEFTENASHELQTPIAIIRSRLESISQLPLERDAANYLKDAKKALDRLSKVNKGLLLLTKLSHDFFPDRQLISLQGNVTGHIEQLEELFESKGLLLQHDLQDVSVNASPYLVDIMVSNFLSNMLKHSSPKALLMVRLDNNKLEFENTGKPLPFAEELLFSRFKKENHTTGGIGLGLSIIKQICQVHQWRVEYAYTGDKHIFSVYFS